MSAHKPDCFFREKTLFPGQGHDWKAHRHDIVTLVVHGRLDEVFAAGAQHCGRWELHFKPHGTPHRTHTGPEGVRMFMVGVASTSGGFPAGEAGSPRFDRPQLCGGGIPVARALRLLLPLAGEGHGHRAIDPRTSVDLAGIFDGGGRRQAGAPSWITEVHELIHPDTDAPGSLEGLAARFRVHAVYLARAFRRHYGVSIGAMRRRMRIDRAVDSLTRSSAPLAELAMDLGYADQSHFTREFKRETGWSPGRFRHTAASLGALALP